MPNTSHSRVHRQTAVQSHARFANKAENPSNAAGIVVIRPVSKPLVDPVNYEKYAEPIIISARFDDNMSYNEKK